jgi:hypothetical protein
VPSLHTHLRRSALALLCAGILLPAPADATRIRHRNVEELARAADRIFVGTCLSAEEKRRGNLYFTEYVFSVDELVKWPERPGSGRPPRLAFRQLSAPPGGQVVGLPRYAPGVRYLLMLHADSSEGLTSPAGFAQGAFRVFEERGERWAVNSLGNLGLFHRMAPPADLSPSASRLWSAASASPPGPIGMRRLVDLLRTLSPDPGR